ncbi:uncharacterized protein LACBIDRAFT_325667 [Laccaria bicolor S238N-H82]|uniref:Predicted protein n=1 Tax=Laccaria bicolor (strain S238N-H82 / ATCC MYA-4686) TaxID=486041 RepID=B0D5T9_LACBS|nr:uncharacterized protein LACBIDRAFT_325667 [Laccaria bicolor S238N-H82]EDR09831.1 predicted protein [Laccaria bicolor S238N-H82]|eukprot:XP_001879216.1 predicted protein [Laccaria bicolor S238N-H82]
MTCPIRGAELVCLIAIYDRSYFYKEAGHQRFKSRWTENYDDGHDTQWFGQFNVLSWRAVLLSVERKKQPENDDDLSTCRSHGRKGLGVDGVQPPGAGRGAETCSQSRLMQSGYKRAAMNSLSNHAMCNMRSQLRRHRRTVVLLDTNHYHHCKFQQSLSPLQVPTIQGTLLNALPWSLEPTNLFYGHVY